MILRKKPKPFEIIDWLSRFRNLIHPRTKSCTFIGPRDSDGVRNQGGRRRIGETFRYQ